ncbi:MAG: MFS transporter [Rhizobiaceae bacterium]
MNSYFKRFVLASGFTNLADGIATVAWAWLASLLTRDPILIATVPIALRLPWFLFAIPAGIVTDRTDRRLLILRMDALRAIAFLVAGLAVWQALPLAPAPQYGVSDTGLFAALIVAALAVGIAEVFRDNAAQTILPSIVPHDALEKANGRMWSVELVGNALLGPALGAFLIAYALPLPLLVNAAAYVLAVVLVVTVAGKFRPEEKVARNWRRELREGVEFLRQARLMRSLAWITGFWNLLFNMVLIALLLHVQENLQAGARTYGLILASGAVGGILGGWMGDRVVARLGPCRTAQFMLLASVPAFLAMALAPNAIALCVVFAVFEFTGIVWNTVSVSYRQRTIPDELLGRVNSVYRLLAWGMMPVGLALSGIIVRLMEEFVERPLALIAPFLAATVGAIALGWIGWYALDRGFADMQGKE